MELRIYVEAPADLPLIRRFRRDTAEPGRRPSRSNEGRPGRFMIERLAAG
jgi:hypothetical protein